MEHDWGFQQQITKCLSPEGDKLYYKKFCVEIKEQVEPEARDCPG